MEEKWRRCFRAVLEKVGLYMAGVGGGTTMFVRVVVKRAIGR